MTLSISDPYAQAAYKVQLIAGGQLVSTTEPTPGLHDARRVLDGVKPCFPDSILMVALGSGEDWRPATPDMLARISHQARVAALAQFMDYALPLISWELPSYAPDKLVGRPEGENDKRETIAAIADIIGAEVEEKASGGRVLVTASCTWRGVRVEIQAVVAADEPAQEAA